MDTAGERKHGSMLRFAPRARARVTFHRGGCRRRDGRFRSSPPFADRLRDSGAEGQSRRSRIHAGLLFMFATAMATMGEDDREDIGERSHSPSCAPIAADADADAEEARAVAAPDLLGKGKPGVVEVPATVGKERLGNKGDMGKRSATHPGPLERKGERVQGRRDHRARRARQEAATFGIIGILAQHDANDANAPVAPWGSILNGADGENHIGNNWAPTIDDAFGDGLGLSCGGEGGGGKGEGIGLGHIGTLGPLLATPGAAALRASPVATARAPVACGHARDEDGRSFDAAERSTLTTRRLPAAARRR